MSKRGNNYSTFEMATRYTLGNTVSKTGVYKTNFRAYMLATAGNSPQVITFCSAGWLVWYGTE